MAVYPVSLKYKDIMRKRPSVAQIEQHWCERIEAWINEQGLKQTTRGQIITYGQIANALSISRDDVERICFQLDAGGNGFTLVRQDIQE